MTRTSAAAVSTDASTNCQGSGGGRTHWNTWPRTTMTPRLTGSWRRWAAARRKPMSDVELADVLAWLEGRQQTVKDPKAAYELEAAEQHLEAYIAEQLHDKGEPYE